MSSAFDSSIVRDLYKDAYGSRPSSNWMEQWNLATALEKQAIWDQLCNALDYELERERQAEAAAFDHFAAHVAEMQRQGASDAVTAIRWLIDAEGLNEHDLRYGADYIAWYFGLSYQNPLRGEIAQAISEMMDRYEQR